MKQENVLSKIKSYIIFMNGLQLKKMLVVMFLASTLITSLAACQRAPAKISGTIQLLSNSPVGFPPVEVRLMDTRRDQNDPRAVAGLMSTDSNGYYEFANLKPGKYSLGMTAKMPPGVTCNPPSLLRVEQWLIGASYATNDQGAIEPTLLAVWDASIEAEPGADLHFNLQLPVPCQ